MERVHLVPVSRLDGEANSLTGEEVDERFLKIENKLIQKRKDGIEKLEITILKALSSMSENSRQITTISPWSSLRPTDSTQTKKTLTLTAYLTIRKRTHMTPSPLAS